MLIELKKKIRCLFLKGSNVKCPCCEHGFITFIPFGILKRANAQCPNCGSLERHRLLWLYLNERTDFFKKKIKLLHVAPELFFFHKFSKNKNIDYFPIDKYADSYFYPKGTVNMDITKIAYDENTFDVILCNHVLEHIPNDLLAMRELFRVLKPNGWAILQVPLDKKLQTSFEDTTITSPDEREKSFGQFDHVRIYGLDYKIRLETSGFKVNIDNYSQHFSSGDIFKYGIFKDEEIYYCKKT